MTITAGAIVSDAVARAFPFVTDDTKAPGPLLSTLSSIDSEVVGMVASMTPHLLSATATPVDIVYSNNATGYSLQSGARAYIDFKWEDSDNHIYPVRVVPLKQLDDPPVHPAGAVQAGVFYPADPMGRRWTDTSATSIFWAGNGDKLHYRYITEPTALTSLSSVLGSPDMARTYLVASLESYLLLVYHGVYGVVPRERLETSRFNVEMARHDLWQRLVDSVSVESSTYTV